MEGLLNTISHKGTKNTKGFMYLWVYHPLLKENRPEIKEKKGNLVFLFPSFLSVRSVFNCITPFYTNGQ
jgi:hypothetical protein